MLREAGRWGRDRIWLGVWDGTTARSSSTRSWGFEKAGARPFRLGNDVSADIIMQKSVETEGI